MTKKEQPSEAFNTLFKKFEQSEYYQLLIDHNNIEEEFISSSISDLVEQMHSEFGATSAKEWQHSEVEDIVKNEIENKFIFGKDGLYIDYVNTVSAFFKFLNAEELFVDESLYGKIAEWKHYFETDEIVQSKKEWFKEAKLEALKSGIDIDDEDALHDFISKKLKIDRIYLKMADLEEKNDILTAFEMLDDEEKETLSNYEVQKAIDNFDPVLANKALEKLVKFNKGKFPKSEDEFNRLIDKHLNPKEQIAMMGLMAKMSLEDEDNETSQETFRREEPKIGRNDMCPCGSGKKYKKCHGK